MAPRFANRFTKARLLMAEKGLDLLLVINRENLIYWRRYSRPGSVW